MEWSPKPGSKFEWNCAKNGLIGAVKVFPAKKMVYCKITDQNSKKLWGGKNPQVVEAMDSTEAMMDYLRGTRDGN